MTRDRNKFSCLIEKEGGSVIFGGKNKGKIIGKGKNGKSFITLSDDVCLVEGLNYNFLSISQLCDKGHEVIFDSLGCTIF